MRLFIVVRLASVGQLGDLIFPRILNVLSLCGEIIIGILESFTRTVRSMKI